MTLGEKIKDYRLLHNMTQKELGMKVGFSAVTADTRIRQYEKDAMAPKSDIRNKLIQALDLDYSALSDIDIHSIEDVVRVFFFMEEYLGFEIEKVDLSNYQFFSKDRVYFQEREIQTLNSYMYIWQQQKKNLLNAKNDNEEDSYREYRLWKSRFSLNIDDYWSSIFNKVNSHYDSLVNSISVNKPKTVYIYEFMKTIRKLIEAGLKFEVASESRTPNYGYLVFVFKVSDMLSPKSNEIESLFTEFLNDLKTFEEYGMNIDVQILTFPLGNTISYHLRLNPLMPLRGCIEELIEFENKKDSMDDYSKELFENMFEHRHKSYFNLDIHEEIDVYYHHDQ